MGQHDRNGGQNHQNIHLVNNGMTLRLDLKLGCTSNNNKKKKSHKFYIDLQNSTNRDTIFLRKYNKITNSVGQINQAEFFPDFGHRFQF